MVAAATSMGGMMNPTLILQYVEWQQQPVGPKIWLQMLGREPLHGSNTKNRSMESQTISEDLGTEYLEDEYEMTWIQWYCSLWGHEVFAEVDEEFIRDGFNLFGLKPKISSSKYDKALEMILGPAPRQQDFHKKELVDTYQEASNLYGLIHARFITTPKGLVPMKEKFMQGVFGRCPRYLCDKQNVLPVGLTEELKQHRARVYCPFCQETYLPRMSAASQRSPTPSADIDDEDDDEDEGTAPNIDGAFFGPSFPHIFLLQYTALIPKVPPEPYVPKVFGFRIRGVKSVIQVKLEAGEYGKAYSLSETQDKRNAKTVNKDQCSTGT
eukprot:Blabericola_migrator_1__11153@NODE_653_length_7026_cov_105_228625_g479_i0_p2_GENE_NODE_653_length_7026_cov_105_228625_g479_i0NODE_653_length_7026_cov_105_228625_g479_i0_p2_ORF_typecomplete_len325_score37_35CK_II_beta/PF01214_18/1_8e61_NODE_653_length_7026_cov_105_228625_g479_i09791953